MGNYFNPEIETMPVEQIKALQSKRLIEQVRHVYQNVAFYRDKMDAAGVRYYQYKRSDRTIEINL